MPILLIVVACIAILFIAYETYGRWLAKRLFRLDAGSACPSETRSDGKDFVPSNKFVLFGHHFTSIAGTGPIVGPAIAVYWGWAPALIWIVVGSIFIGALHDMGSLIASARNEGQTLGDIAGKYVSRRVRTLFMIIVFVFLAVFIAVLGLVISTVFKMFPSAIFPSLVQIPLAIAIGYWMQHKGRHMIPVCVGALVLMYLSVIFGDVGLLHSFNLAMSAMPTWAWIAILLAYSYAASVLPVWLLLQPRDFINALQLASICVLLFCGMVVAACFAPEGSHLSLVAPAFNFSPHNAPPILPFLFITIACGAASGFHNIVSSGTTSKQLKSEPDALPIGYGGMLSEAALAMIVVLSCCAGIGLGITRGDGIVLHGTEAWNSCYSSWVSVAGGGFASSVSAFVMGAGNFLTSLGISHVMATAFIGLFVACFAATSMDTSCRLQRYVVEELSKAFFERRPRPKSGIVERFTQNRHGATLLAIAVSAVLSAMPAHGQVWSLSTVGSGGMILWPLFGVTNQLLVGLAFIVLICYMRAKGMGYKVMLIPCIFMVIMPVWAIIMQLYVGWEGGLAWVRGNTLLACIGSAVVVMEVWMIAEAFLLIRYGRTAKTHKSS